MPSHLVRLFGWAHPNTLPFGPLFAVLLLAAGSPLPAQSNLENPKRPKLGAQQDTNSAVDYFQYGNSVIGLQPEKAAAAFYWAARLDPSMASPLYGQYAALLLDQTSRDLIDYLVGRNRQEKKALHRQLDSLYYAALLKNPFLDRRLDGVILSAWLRRATNGEMELRDLGRFDRRFTAWAAYARGDYKMASSVYGEEIRRRPNSAFLYLQNALCYFSLGQLDSARGAMTASLSLERDAEEDYVGWTSHAFTEYSIGILHDLGGQRDSARAAYERALLDDVRFPPAHRQLGRARLLARDTAGALAEYNEAAALAPNDAIFLYDLGMLLMAAGRQDSAVTVLRQATAVEPYFALPHYPLGIIYEQGGFKQEASEHFTAFLQLAPRSMQAAIAVARKRLDAIHPAGAN